MAVCGPIFGHTSWHQTTKATSACAAYASRCSTPSSLRKIPTSKLFTRGTQCHKPTIWEFGWFYYWVCHIKTVSWIFNHLTKRYTNEHIGRESQAKRMALQWSRVRPFTYFLFFEGPLSTPCNPWWQSLFWTPRSLQLTGRSFVASGPAITANQVHKSSFAGTAAWRVGCQSIHLSVVGHPFCNGWQVRNRPRAPELPVATLVPPWRCQQPGWWQLADGSGRVVGNLASWSFKPWGGCRGLW